MKALKVVDTATEGSEKRERVEKRRRDTVRQIESETSNLPMRGLYTKLSRRLSGKVQMSSEIRLRPRGRRRDGRKQTRRRARTSRSVLTDPSIVSSLRLSDPFVRPDS